MSLSKTRWALAALGVSALLVAGGCASGEGDAARDAGSPIGASAAPGTLGASGVLYQPPIPVEGFTLTGPDGGRVSLAGLRGQVVALYFGYTHCPDMCPLTLGTYKAALERLPAEVSDQVRVVMVSVDPDRDTPEILSRYMALFGEDFMGLTGSVATIDAVLANWDIEIARGTPGESGSYTVEHPADSWVLDQEGRLRLKVAHMTGVDALAADLQTIVEEGQP